LDLLYFILFVSILIFIHELGHFAAAKMFGVKVLTFAIGFGPKIIRIRGRETEYCLGILPFGGFVKMLEEGKGETILPEEKKRTFEAQSLGKRVLIVLAGPAMNVLFPVVLYTSVYMDDRTFEQPAVGTVLDHKPADGKLEPGDVIDRIDGKEMESFPDVQSAIKGKAGAPVIFSITRDGKQLDVPITPEEEVLMLEPVELEMTELGVGNEHAVVEQRRADAGTDRHGHHEAAVPARRAVTRFRDTCGVRVVEHDAWAIDRPREHRGRVRADP